MALAEAHFYNSKIALTQQSGIFLLTGNPELTQPAQNLSHFLQLMGTNYSKST